MTCKKCGCSCNDLPSGKEHPSVKKMVIYYADKYQKKHGLRYAISWPRDVKALSDLCHTQDEAIIKRVIDGYIENAANPDIHSFAKFFPSFAIRAKAGSISKEDAEAERNRRYIEYYSQEAVLKRAQNGEI